MSGTGSESPHWLQPDPLFGLSHDAHTLTAPLLPLQGLRFTVVPSRFKENLRKASFPTPYAYAMETAKQKALEVARRMHQARALLLPLGFWGYGGGGVEGEQSGSK